MLFLFFFFFSIYNCVLCVSLCPQATVEGKPVRGVDIIRWNEAGKIVEFEVMMRPVKPLLRCVHACSRLCLDLCVCAGFVR
jgi:hypothetical protein